MKDDVIVLNADTFFAVPFSNIGLLHEQTNSECLVSLKPMINFDRYGAVTVNDKKQITGFSEKKYQTNGLINGGVYVLASKQFLERKFPAVFSFEKDYLEMNYGNGNIMGYVSDAYFIDIGIPEDYLRSQTELPKAVLDL